MFTRWRRTRLSGITRYELVARKIQLIIRDWAVFREGPYSFGSTVLHKTITTTEYFEKVLNKLNWQLVVAVTLAVAVSQPLTARQ